MVSHFSLKIQKDDQICSRDINGVEYYTFNLGFDSNNYKLSFLSKGKQNNVAQFETTTDSYFLMNISGSHKFNLGSNNLGFVWSINNLLDEEYYDHLSRFKNMGIHEMGRNISFGLNYKF